MQRLFFLLALAFTLGTGALTAAPALAQASAVPAATDSATGSDQKPLQQLLDVLKDDQARQELITELEKTLNDQPQAEQDKSAMGTELRSVGAQVADFTQAVAENIREGSLKFFVQLLSVPEIFGGLTPNDLSFLFYLFIDLALLVVITYGGLIAMMKLTNGLRGRLKLTIRRNGWFAKIMGVLGTLLLDICNLAVPLALGYLIAFSVLGRPGQLSFSHSLYLNAFLTVELLMAVLRSVLAPRRDAARLVDLDGTGAAAVMHWSRTIAMLLVYGQLLVLPLVSRTLSADAGRAIAIVGLAVVIAVMAAAVMRAHGFITSYLGDRTRHNRAVALVTPYWHVPVLLYLAVLFLIALARPLSDIYAILFMNFKIVIAIVAGIVISNVLTAAIGKGVPLPQSVNVRVPLLERRINAFVPRVLEVIRLLVILAVIAFCVHVLGLMNVPAFFASEFGGRVVGAFVTVALILLVAFALWLVLSSWVEYRINPDYGTPASPRERTLLTLMKNAFTITLIVIALMFVLSEVGINIAPLLASAGVIGLAIGFGAQKLVQDIITGIFIQLENAMDVGDVVSIGGISGVVERLTVRSAALRDLEGRYHVVPFSSVDTVTNFMRGFSYALIDMGVAYREDTENAKQAMFDAFEELKKDEEVAQGIVDELEWLGLDSFGASEIVLRARIKTLPGKQWGTRRAYNAVLKRIFDQRNIEIPFPHQTVYFGEDKSGKAPPLHMVRDDDATSPEEPAAKPKRARRSKPQPQPRDNSGNDLPDPDAGPDGDDH